ncbi:MAG: cysteine desulfurase [Urechidicola sp.]|jgi:cysteine desulfurase
MPIYQDHNAALSLHFEWWETMVGSASCLKHTDATQVVGKLNSDMCELGVDVLTLSEHNFLGPQSFGASVVKRKPKQLLINGDAQEKYRRAGTENGALIVGIGKVAQIETLEIEYK